ncbi:hypothetical protein CRUP_006731, partial [Coryphaenoides rupestris]
ELSSSRANLQKVQTDLEKHRGDMDRKVMEVIALKKAHQEQEAELKYETDRLKDQLKRAREELAKEQQKGKKLPDPSVIFEMEQKIGEAKVEVTRLQEKLSLAEEELQSVKTRLGRAQTELADAQLQTSSTESSELEVALHTEIRGLRFELDETKRKASQLSQEACELRQSLE